MAQWSSFYRVQMYYEDDISQEVSYFLLVLIAPKLSNRKNHYTFLLYNLALAFHDIISSVKLKKNADDRYLSSFYFKFGSIFLFSGFV